MLPTIIGPFNATITTIGGGKGVLFPKEFVDAKSFQKLLNVKKHKITVTIETID